MGRGIIISGGTAGEYSVQLTLMRTRFDTAITNLNSQITILDTYIATLPAGHTKNVAELKKTALEKRIEYMTANMPDNPTITAWCADLTEDLSGDVGTIEVPGERGQVVIQPGYDDNAVYDANRDGQLAPSLNNTFEGLFYNLAMLPGWQKWKPTYRFGTISNLIGDTCDVVLEPAKSSQQSLDVNQTATLTSVPIEYMTCDGSAFSNGDNVVVEFVDQNWSDPKVIGFKDNPVTCGVTTGSAEFDGALEQYITIPDSPDWAIVGDQNFTFDFQARMKSYPTLGSLFHIWSQLDLPAPAFAEMSIEDDHVGINYFTPIGNWGVGAGGLSFDLDTWYHIAWVRWGNNVTIFIDGVLIGTNVESTVTYDISSPARIGRPIIEVGAEWFDGFIDEFRLSNVARWTTGFTPPTAPHIMDGNTLLLMHMDGTNGSTLFPDAAGRHSPVSVNGTSVNTTIKKF